MQNGKYAGLTPQQKYDLLTKDFLERDGDHFVRIRRTGRLGWEDTLPEGSAYSAAIVNPKSDRELLLNASKLARQMIVAMDTPFKVKVRISTNKSCTDSKEVFVATKVFDEPDMTPGEKLDVFLGLTVHEGSHLLYTDFAALKAPKMRNRLLCRLENIIEDEMIERHLGERKPGLANFLKATKYYYFGKYADAAAEVKQDRMTRLFNAVISLIRYPASLPPRDAEEFADELLRVRDILTPFPEDTPGCVEKAGELLELFKELAGKALDAMKKEQERQKKQENQEGNAQQGQPDNDGNSDGNGDPQESQTQEGDPGEDRDEPENDGSEPDEKPDGEAGNETEDGDEDPGDEDIPETDDGDEPDPGQDTGQEDGNDDGDDLPEEDPEDDTPEEGDGEEDGEEGDGDDSEEGKGSPETEDPGNPDNDDPEDNDSESVNPEDDDAKGPDKVSGNGTEGDADGEGDPTDGDGDADGGAAPLSDEETEKMLNDILDAAEELGTEPGAGQNPDEEQMCETAREKDQRTAMECDGDLETGILPGTVFIRKEADHRTYADSLRRVKRYVNATAAALRCNDTDYAYTLTGLRNGLLDTNRLAEARQGVPTVYMKKGRVRTDRVNLAVLVDESYSMDGYKETLARDTAVLLREATENISNVELYMYGYTSTWNAEANIFPYAEGRTRYDKDIIGSISAINGTPTAQAVMECAARIRRTSRVTTLMFIISDGMAIGGTAAVRKAVDKAQADGFQVIGISIDPSLPEEKLKEMYDRSIAMTDISQLPLSLSKTVKAALLRTAKKTRT